MTLEELKAEAKKHGYKLTKDYPYIKLAPCVCGHKSQHISWTSGKTPYYYKCYKCGLTAQFAKTKYEAKLKWNECVENARKEKQNENY